MKQIDTKARLFYIALAFVTPAFAQTGVWTPPVVLSTGGQGWEAAAAMDGNGNSLALWDERTSEDHLWSRSKPSGGSWGHASQLSSGPLGLQATGVFPAMRITPAGFATAVWDDSTGVWTADRPRTGQWNASQLLIPGAFNPIFVMNARGDAAIAWTIGGPPGSTSSVMAVVRPAGQAWSSPQTLASGAFVSADHAGIGVNGAVVVTWESFNAQCTPEGCATFNFVLRASRADVATGSWVHSGVLLGPDPNSHGAHVALDSHGRAMLVALSSSGAFISSTQGSSGGAWSPFNTAVALQTSVIVSGLASDNAGNVTMVYETIGFLTYQAMAIDGAITGNAWSPPVVLSGSDTSVGQIYFALASNGAALAAWLSSGGTPEVHAVLRPTTAGAWSSPATVSVPGSTEIGPEAAAVNTSGNAIVVYSGYDPAQVHTEYASNFTP